MWYNLLTSIVGAKGPSLYVVSFSVSVYKCWFSHHTLVVTRISKKTSFRFHWDTVYCQLVFRLNIYALQMMYFDEV